MARIDLKNVDIYIQDGYVGIGTGLINHISGYAAGVTTIKVDGFIGAVANGDTFTIASESGTPTHTITSHTEIAGNTRSVTFTTVIATGGVADNAAIVFQKLGAVNNGGGYPSGTLTITVNNFTGAIANGDTFTIAAETGSPTHTVTSHTESVGNTISITFTTAIASGGVADTAVVTVHKAGAVNQPYGYVAGTTVIVVDGYVGAVVTGDEFTIDGDYINGVDGLLTVHTITSHIESTGNTTSITFTPAIVSGVLDDANIITQPHHLKIKVGDGNLSWTIHKAREYLLDKGLIDTVRNGNQEPIDVKLDLVYEFLKSSGSDAPTIEEALGQIGNASTWITSGSDPCEPYAVDVVLVHTPLCTTQPIEKVILNAYRWETLDHDPKAATISSAGKCNQLYPTISRILQV